MAITFNRHTIIYTAQNRTILPNHGFVPRHSGAHHRACMARRGSASVCFVWAQPATPVPRCTLHHLQLGGRGGGCTAVTHKPGPAGNCLTGPWLRRNNQPVLDWTSLDWTRFGLDHTVGVASSLIQHQPGPGPQQERHNSQCKLIQLHMRSEQVTWSAGQRVNSD